MQASSCYLRLSFIRAFWSYMYWQGKNGLRWVTMWVSQFPITLYLENLSTFSLKSNRMIVRRIMAPNTWRRRMKGEGMLDRISIVHWMSLPITPILWTTSVTNCRILSQEICFRGSEYYKCSLVSGWRHTVSLTSLMDFARLFETLWSPWR